MAYVFSKDKLGDFIILLLFDKVFNEEFLSDNERFEEVFSQLDKLNLRSILFDKYFEIDSGLRTKYKRFRSKFDKEDTNVMLYIIPGEEEKKNESIQQKVDSDDLVLSYKQLIYECIRKITGKENPDPLKVEEFTNNMLSDILFEDKQEEEVNE